jgi:hypothetical protein
MRWSESSISFSRPSVPCVGPRHRNRVPSIGDDRTREVDNIEVFSSQWQLTRVKFTDPNGLAAGFNAFIVQNLNGLLYVTYTSLTIDLNVLYVWTFPTFH